MNAKEARGVARLNQDFLDSLTSRRVRDHIKEEVNRGRFSVTLGYSVPEFVKEELREEGYNVSSSLESTTIRW